MSIFKLWPFIPKNKIMFNCIYVGSFLNADSVLLIALVILFLVLTLWLLVIIIIKNEKEAILKKKFLY